MRYGPPGGKRLVYFVDDMNMALVDKYDTQSAVEIMRQSIDYRGWFEKTKIFLKARSGLSSDTLLLGTGSEPVNRAFV